jgi:hypothetical protein
VTECAAVASKDEPYLRRIPPPIQKRVIQSSHEGSDLSWTKARSKQPPEFDEHTCDDRRATVEPPAATCSPRLCRWLEDELLAPALQERAGYAVRAGDGADLI